jgi:hypothetical protein
MRRCESHAGRVPRPRAGRSCSSYRQTPAETRSRRQPRPSAPLLVAVQPERVTDSTVLGDAGVSRGGPAPREQSLDACYLVQMTSSISRVRSANFPSGDVRRSSRRNAVSNSPTRSPKRCGAAQESEKTDATTSSSERS